MPIAWQRVHVLPDFVFFDHGVHVAKGVGLRRVPRPRRPDAAHLARAAAADAVVPRLPPRPGAAPAAADAGVRHGRAAPPPAPRRGSSRAPLQLESTRRADRLLDLPPLTRAHGTHDPRRRSRCASMPRPAPARGVSAGARRSALMAASVALASGACSPPPRERIHPWVDMPEARGGALPLYYASAFVRDGYAHGVLVGTQRGPADQDRGQSGASVQPRRDRRVRAGVGAASCGIPIARSRAAAPGAAGEPARSRAAAVELGRVRDRLARRAPSACARAAARACACSPARSPRRRSARCSPRCSQR